MPICAPMKCYQDFTMTFCCIAQHFCSQCGQKKTLLLIRPQCYGHFDLDGMLKYHVPKV